MHVLDTFGICFKFKFPPLFSFWNIYPCSSCKTRLLELITYFTILENVTDGADCLIVCRMCICTSALSDLKSG